jgi:ketosteroid isomerase-like protein
MPFIWNRLAPIDLRRRLVSAEENKQTARDGYAAFIRGDAAGAMATIHDSVEWVVGGDNALTGVYHGKEEVGAFWARLGEKGFRTEPSEFLADGDKVVVLTTYHIGGDQSQSVDIASYDANGKLARFESFGGEDLLDRAFPK